MALCYGESIMEIARSNTSIGNVYVQWRHTVAEDTLALAQVAVECSSLRTLCHFELVVAAICGISFAHEQRIISKNQLFKQALFLCLWHCELLSLELIMHLNVVESIEQSMNNWCQQDLIRTIADAIVIALQSRCSKPALANAYTYTSRSHTQTCDSDMKMNIAATVEWKRKSARIKI